MSRKRLIYYISSLAFIIPVFFGNILIFNNKYLDIFGLFSSLDFNPIFLLYFIPFLIYLILVILFPIYRKNTTFNRVFACLSFISFVLILIFPLLISCVFSFDYSSLKNGYCSYIFFTFYLATFCYFLSHSFKTLSFSVREMTEMSFLVALAIILDFKVFKIPMAANGGSISFAMVPLLIIALRFGFLKSFIADGIVFGIITCLIDGYGIVTFPFDYLLGFGSLAVLSFFAPLILKEKKYTFKMVLFLLLGIICCFACRTLAATLSGMVIYRLAFIPSLTYQMLYLPASFGACFGVLLILYKPLIYINHRFPNS